MRRWMLMGLVGLAGCATAPAEAPSVSTAMVLWLRPPAGECDFEHPDREDAWAVSTSRDTPPAGPRPSAYSYVVRDLQLRARPPEDVNLCLSVVRYRAFGETQAVFGFSGRSLDAERLELTARYTRMDTSVVGQPGSAVRIEIGFAAARLDTAGTLGSTTSGAVGLAGVEVGGPGRAVGGAPIVLRWPAAGAAPDILRIVAVVSESSADGPGPPISAEVLQRTLGEVEQWARTADATR